MQGWKIFKHSYTQIFSNFGAAIRISALLFVASVIVGQFWVNSIGDSFYDGIWLEKNSSWDLFLPAILSSSIVGIWLAVAWHRFILTGEIANSWIPKLHVERMWSYFLRGILITIIWVFSTSITVGIIFGILAGRFSNSFGTVGLLWIIPFLIIISIFFICIRISVILPAAALGKKLSLDDAWRSTEGATGAIIVVLLLVATLSIPSILLQPLMLSNSVLSFIWSVTYGWVMIMLGISLLTTLYGHYVEGRALNA